MDLFDTLTFAEILGRTTFLGTLSLTVPQSSAVAKSSGTVHHQQNLIIASVYNPKPRIS
jgi:CTP-dependent riboflavin kinase